MIETKNFFLKEYDEKYIEKAHLNFFSSYNTAKYVLWRPTNSPLEVKDKVEYWLNEVKVSIFFFIHLKENDEPIGFISLDEISENIYGNVGIAIGEKYISKGYGSEVLGALLNHVKLLGAKEIYYSHFKENEASKRLALKFGFEYYKTDKRIRKYDNKEFDELFYILKLDGSECER